MAKRGGFPGGMPGNMNNLMKQAQKMQKQMEENQKALEEKEFTASAGGGTKGGAETSVSADKAVKTGDVSTAVLWAAAVLAAAAVVLQAGKKIK